MAYEFCLYQADEGVIYAEVRYCPHLLMPQLFNDSKVDYLADSGNKSMSNAQISLSSIVEAVNRGLTRGEAEYGIVCRTILSCIRGMPQWSAEILDLCVHFRDHEVVGIDIAGNESGEKLIEGEEKGKSAKVGFFSDFQEIFTFCFPEGRMLDPEDIGASSSTLQRPSASNCALQSGRSFVLYQHRRSDRHQHQTWRRVSAAETVGTD